MVTLCGNCEKAVAVAKCQQCEDSLAFLCTQCESLHVQIKQFRSHHIQPLSKTDANSLCRNCESSPAKLVCKQCREEDRYLCLGCSVLHPKIKAFRNHEIFPLFEGSSSHIDFSKLWQISTLSWADVNHVITQLYRNLTERSINDKAFWISVIVVVGMGAVYYIACKKIFAGFSTVANVVVGIVIFKYVASWRSEETFAPVDIPVTPNRQIGRKSAAELDDSDFANEFDYPLTGKQASFRPRTRAYKPRKTNKQTAETSDIVLEDVD